MADNLPVPLASDFTARDLEKIQEYELAGMPGLDKVSDDKLARMMDLYLEGKDYNQISRIMQIQKTIIMYLSHRFKWRVMRLEYLADLEEHLRTRTLEAKVVGQDFLLQLQHMFQKKIGKKIQDYLATGDEKFADGINLKEVDKFFKTIEAIEKIGSDKAKKGRNGKPLVGLNLGENGATITQVGENSFEVTPKDKTKADKLKEFADLRRQQEAQAKADKSDINKKDPNEQKGESNET